MSLNKKKINIVNSFFIYWLPVVLWALVIFSFSSVPTGTASHIDWQDFVIKKTAHVVVYFVLSSLIYRALRHLKYSRSSAAFAAIILSILYGFSDEYHQSFTPGRDPRLRDVMFDSLGAVLAIYSIWNVLPKMPKQIRKLARDLKFD